ncbi:MAG: phytase [Anaerolineales bacterium]|nr:phytase [Anaerolineales bacterium]
MEVRAEPEDGETRTQVDTTGPEGHLTADVEGLALYYAKDGTGYLLASSQGNSRFVVYERGGDNAYVGTFRLVADEEAEVDAVSGTDGIDVTSFPLGDAFPEGVFVAQDNLNITPAENQNFKLASWGAIANAFDPPLTVDTSWDPRLIGAKQ